MSTTKKPRVNIDYYEQPKTISYFEAIINTLRIDLDKEGANTSFGAPDLAYFTAHFLKFQIDHLGRDAADKARRHRKSIEAGVPFSLFDVRHLTTNSSLYYILKAAYKFKSDYRIADWHFDSLDEAPTYLEMVKVIKQALDKAGFEQCIPHVFFDTSIDAHKKKKMTLLVEGLGGVIVKEISDASFIIYNEEQIIDRFHKNWRIVHQTDDDDNQAIIHWIGLPDSYNAVLSLENCAKEKEDVTLRELTKDHQRAPWHVKFNWIEDSVRYNEWMTPLDYIMIEKQQTQQPKRKRSAVEQEDDHLGGDQKEGNLITNSNKKAKTPEPQEREIAIKYMPTQKYEVIIPSYAAWFDLSSIHVIEVRGLPEFFNNKNKTKTPTVYKEYRDFMVNTYRLNPSEYLTVTSCRRNMTGDVCSIIRVHAFLEQWGLINYQIDPTAKPTAIGPPFEGQIKIIAQLPSVLNKSLAKENDTDIYHRPTNKSSFELKGQNNFTSKVDKQVVKNSTTMKNEKSSFSTPSIDLNLDLRVNIYDVAMKKTIEEESKKEIEAKIPETCSSCSSQSNHGYHSNTTFICDDCYDANKLPEFTQKEDYKKRKEIELKKLPEPWTEQEEMLLLEGLEMFPDDWNKVANHVATKTRDDCILHYLHLPVSDPRVDPEVKKLDLLDFNRKDDIDNPIMSVVAFLASNVKPKVAASSLLEVTTDDDKTEEMTDRDKDDALEMKHDLIRAKMMQFMSRINSFREMENKVNDERRELEKERFLVREEHLTIRNKMDKIYGHMFQVRQAKLLKEKQMQMQSQQQQEELMPNDVIVRGPHEALSPEERELQNQLKARYPIQYFQRQQTLLQQQ
ncbi:uncharacterized protein BX663DRAFT_518051 [Cokeromyces recurvatus]|uniref:uncharacterized protein n=1 Tax=Cokeromyces recurvatus TaxID=90255 RepID=UPI002220B070|nr:uncharacterized protein BX663DRAFT_518051 [Cokeromyces recurvatus]KAI7900259.1 hypothetical protein BX663DRAFT_518051 [Cokeromyces recurvatus]